MRDPTATLPDVACASPGDEDLALGTLFSLSFESEKIAALMHLEQIEITNFKSYRGTYLVGPFDRFTCIIGPNGSGKSNILDAVSFALNAPSSCLRAQQLKNLVSHGETESSVKVFVSGRTFERRITKSPVGTDVAPDSSSLLNEDMDAFTSAMCRYFVDGGRVSQKEYVLGLEGLNIMGRAKNFVIYQGDIIKSDIDLLKTVEAACGSDSYIEEYNALSEKLNTQVKDLGLKYEKRKDCLTILREMDEVKEKERNFGLLVSKKEHIQRMMYGLQISNKKEEIKRLKDALNSLESLRNEGLYDKHLEDVNKARGEAARLQKEYFEKEERLMYLKSKASKRGSGDRDEKAWEIKRLEDRLERLHEDLSRFRPSLDIDREEFEPCLAIKEREYSIQVSDLEKRLSELMLQNFDKLSRRDIVQSAIKRMSTKAARINARNLDIERENRIKQERILALDREVEMLRSKIQDRVSSYEMVLADEERLTKDLNDVMRDILLSKARKNDMSRRSQIKRVVGSLKDIFAGVHGRVIDLVEPTQKKYEVPIGVLLSRYDQAIVVDTERVAMDCLRYIKDTKSCKLTFLPLSRIKSRSHVPKLECENRTNMLDTSPMARCEILSKKCISFDQAYEKVVDFVLGGSLIVDTAAAAKDILYSSKYSGKICTLDGTLFNPNGLITGGRDPTNKFEDNIVDALLEKRRSILNDIRNNRDRKEAFSDVAAIRDRISELLARKDSIRLEEPETAILDEMDLPSHQCELKSLESSLKDFECQRKAILEAKKQIERSVISPLLATVGISSLSEYRERVREEIKRQEVTIEIEALRDKIELLKEDLDMSSGSDSDAVSPKDIEAMERELCTLYGHLENAKDHLSVQSRALRSVGEKRSELNATILAHQLQLSRTEEELKDIVKYATLESGLREELCGEDPEASSNPENGGVVSIDALRAELEVVNKRINENIPTISSTDSSIQAKYSRLNREYDMAKETVAETKSKFVEIRKLRMDSFAQCFSRISSELPRIYQSLTGSDTSAESSAYLIYEGDPFANNLRYYLMPPSKRFTEFHELSGGEKSMALLSFILALGQYKKPPFYIFDEVDSALDKANVERLLSYVLESSDQFVVVSLKHQFFQRSESLLGVYKCPHEIKSKVLSYRLK